MYDVSVDGRFLMMIEERCGTDGRAPALRIILVQNWFEEVKRLVPPKVTEGCAHNRTRDYLP
jgi:hypothetical protein